METLQTPHVFLHDLLTHIEKAKISVLLQTMILEVGEIEELLEKACIKAVKRGVDVRIHYDWISQKYVHGELQKHFFDTAFARHLHQENARMYARLQSAGVKLYATNIPHLPLSFIPFVGRDHRKIYIVDNQIGWVGGVNLFDKSFDIIDFMVKTNNSSLLNALTNEFFKIKKQHQLQDDRIVCDTDYTIFSDGGKSGKSIIYGRALNLISHAQQSITFMSQYVPDGILLKKLIKKSDQGVKVVIITSFIKSSVFTQYPERLSYLYFSRAIKNHPNITFMHAGTYVHAKLLYVDQKEAFFGSHNLTYSGVLFGTEEIMIDTTHHLLVTQIDQFINSYTK